LSICLLINKAGLAFAALLCSTSPEGSIDGPFYKTLGNVGLGEIKQVIASWLV
jgi:hypothetical protein